MWCRPGWSFFFPQAKNSFSPAGPKGLKMPTGNSFKTNSEFSLPLIHNEPNLENCEIRVTFAKRNYAHDPNNIWRPFTGKQ
jgi:hypothetical protein